MYIPFSSSNWIQIRAFDKLISFKFIEFYNFFEK